jgi:uncharacterized protein (DUF2062 family)
VSSGQPIREALRRKILYPLIRQLKSGVTPRRLAWSLAMGMVIGINPTIGLTTLLIILLAWIFDLSQIATQLGSHLVSPLHLLLFVPFLELGVHLFHTRQIPMNRHQLEHLSHHPLHLVRAIWQWEWHALIVWAVIAVVAMPLLAAGVRRCLVILMRRHRILLRSICKVQPAD